MGTVLCAPYRMPRPVIRLAWHPFTANTQWKYSNCTIQAPDNNENRNCPTHNDLILLASGSWCKDSRWPTPTLQSSRLTGQAKRGDQHSLCLQRPVTAGMSVRTGSSKAMSKCIWWSVEGSVKPSRVPNYASSVSSASILNHFENELNATNKEVLRTDVGLCNCDAPTLLRQLGWAVWHP